MEKRLTEYSHGSGCGCKISPADLQKIMAQVSFSIPNKNVLIGIGSNDDAAVYDLKNGTALISTTDFFTPIVDDPKLFGKIAAANALSDVYAMGGTPIVAIAILGWPIGKISLDKASEVLEGGRQICEQIGIALAGGHSIDAPEPFFGLAVNGIVDTDKILRNNTAKTGDLLFLTKPIGTGIISTAIKKGKVREGDKKLMLDQLLQVNSVGMAFGQVDYINSMTDVTGFGLLGHLIEMSESSNLSACIEMSKIKLINAEAIDYYLQQFIFPDNTFRNFNAYKEKVSELSGRQLQILCDPQTNGGLLLSVDPARIKDFELLCKELNLHIEAFGEMVDKKEKIVVVNE